MIWEQTFSNLKTDEELARKLQAEADDESVDISESRQQQEQGDALVAQLLLEEDRREHASAVKTRDCAVCTEAISIPDLPSLANCAHESGTCSACYARWIATELTEKGWKNIRCPGNACRVMLSYDEVRAYATAETFEQYDTFATREALNGDPDFRWCRNAGCSSGQVHVSGVEGNIFTCGACGYRTCVVHENTWHDGETCEEYEYRRSGQKERDQRVQEEASIRAIGEFTKKCPGQNCAYNIEKKHGCDHMTCRSCNYEFCWECLADYNRIRNEGNAAHRTSCKYHSSRIV
ncbi:hypothetical protein BS50DRAFT_487604 [Corynespora cassiicola Philippines]|uniref:RBR-type E3 ubiquitin transferase n=1 Tax=Corynespora cassiicola Philippines TaxID=1448308 RepID=A0A2T2NYJ9_CORCC|nr:hypothetical protein BS50DRAFT_487604 [Corynespora cassiicola Philippines]